MNNSKILNKVNTIMLDYFSEAWSIPRHQVTAYDLNCGYCYYWAALINHILPDAELFSVSGHAFIKIDDKFYDAEKLNGVKNWQSLPSNQKVFWQELSPLSQKEFYKYWKIDKWLLKKLLKSYSD